MEEVTNLLREAFFASDDNQERNCILEAVMAIMRYRIRVSDRIHYETQ